MSSIHLLLSIVGILLLLALLLFAYMQLYRRSINKVLTGRKHRRPMVPPHQLLLILIAIFLASLLALFLMGTPIYSARDVEDYARNHAEEEGLSVRVAVTDELAAVLYYTEDGSDHSFGIYENKGQWRANYVFSHGGSSTSIQRSVHMFRYEDGLIIFSMNELGIAKIVCHDGERYDFSPDDPFVLILPSGSMDFYDAQGNAIDVGQDGWYQITAKD